MSLVWTRLKGREAPLEAPARPGSCVRRQRFTASLAASFNHSAWAGLGVGGGGGCSQEDWNIMTCEPIKQLIRNSSDADDDEGEAGENFIKSLSPAQPPTPTQTPSIKKKEKKLSNLKRSKGRGREVSLHFWVFTDRQAVFLPTTLV